MKSLSYKLYWLKEKENTENEEKPSFQEKTRFRGNNDKDE